VSLQRAAKVNHVAPSILICGDVYQLSGTAGVASGHQDCSPLALIGKGSNPLLRAATMPVLNLRLMPAKWAPFSFSFVELFRIFSVHAARLSCFSSTSAFAASLRGQQIEHPECA
jgi:hypothetical protein